ncbi:hypothetical protein P4S83_14320 [Aneurinibacillus thermoaerophilus]|uniref:hypothetical protein n=1 Tax=Aneurinibacillus thermoaerophilus TaxID=143495 RepID=UPI002E1DB63C|nr:hypothetical protein [Aneurinibacillus thermoaerophilus]MED0764402.1 hypothetical protein [Aneurinibacillus thermoaerophilus]
MGSKATWLLARTILRDYFTFTKKKTILFIVTIILLWNVLYENAGLFFHSVSFLSPSNLVMLSLIGTQIIFLYVTFNWLMSALYYGKNTETLLALPFTKSRIVWTYFAVTLLRFYAFKLLFFLPLVYAAMRAGDSSWTEWGLIMASLFLFPVFTQELSLLLLLVLFSFSVRKGGQHIAIILAAVLFILTAALWLRSHPAYLNAIAETVHHPAFWFGLSGSIGALAVLLQFFIEKSWLKGREQAKQTSVAADFLPGMNNQLLKREIKNFFLTPTFIINYIAMAMLGTVFVFFFINNLSAQLFPSVFSADDIFMRGSAIFAAIYLLAMMMSSSTVAFSRDGTEWTYLRCLPLSFSALFHIKLWFCYAVDILAVFPAAIFLFWWLPLGSVVMIPVLGVAIAGSILTQTLVKMAVDAICPQFAWNSPAQALRHPKRYIAYLVNLIVMGLYGGIGWGSYHYGVFSFFETIFLIILMEAIVAAFLYLFLRIEGKKADRLSSCILKV